MTLHAYFRVLITAALVLIGLTACSAAGTSPAAPTSSGLSSASLNSAVQLASPTLSAAPPDVTTAPAVPPAPSNAAPPPPTTPAGCSPRSNEGTCYEPGEFCRNSDHGATGRAGDGETI